jgi:hypothetical protein
MRKLFIFIFALSLIVGSLIFVVSVEGEEGELPFAVSGDLSYGDFQGGILDIFLGSNPEAGAGNFEVGNNKFTGIVSGTDKADRSSVEVNKDGEVLKLDLNCGENPCNLDFNNGIKLQIPANTNFKWDSSEDLTFPFGTRILGFPDEVPEGGILFGGEGIEFGKNNIPNGAIRKNAGYVLERGQMRYLGNDEYLLMGDSEVIVVRENIKITNPDDLEIDSETAKLIDPKHQWGVKIVDDIREDIHLQTSGNDYCGMEGIHFQGDCVRFTKDGIRISAGVNTGKANYASHNKFKVEFLETNKMDQGRLLKIYDDTYFAVDVDGGAGGFMDLYAEGYSNSLYTANTIYSQDPRGNFKYTVGIHELGFSDSTNPGVSSLEDRFLMLPTTSTYFDVDNLAEGKVMPPNGLEIKGGADDFYAHFSRDNPHKIVLDHVPVRGHQGEYIEFDDIYTRGEGRRGNWLYVYNKDSEMAEQVFGEWWAGGELTEGEKKARDQFWNEGSFRYTDKEKRDYVFTRYVLPHMYNLKMSGLTNEQLALQGKADLRAGYFDGEYEAYNPLADVPAKVIESSP